MDGLIVARMLEAGIDINERILNLMICLSSCVYSTFDEYKPTINGKEKG